MSEVFQRTLWIDGTCEKSKEQEVVVLKGATTGRALVRSVPFLSRTVSAEAVPSLAQEVGRGFEMTD
jgi:hypothetical protein